MSGNKAGGRKAAETNKKIYGESFYAEIGRKGGKNSTHGGFASQKVGRDGLTGRERAAIAGKKGGQNSKRGPAVKQLTEKDLKPRADKKVKKDEKKGWWIFKAKKK